MKRGLPGVALVASVAVCAGCGGSSSTNSTVTPPSSATSSSESAGTTPPRNTVKFASADGKSTTVFTVRAVHTGTAFKQYGCSTCVVRSPDHTLVIVDFTFKSNYTIGDFNQNNLVQLKSGDGEVPDLGGPNFDIAYQNFTDNNGSYRAGTDFSMAFEIPKRAARGAVLEVENPYNVVQYRPIALGLK
jgi:hypothetical protein